MSLRRGCICNAAAPEEPISERPRRVRPRARRSTRSAHPDPEEAFRLGHTWEFSVLFDTSQPEHGESLRLRLPMLGTDLHRRITSDTPGARRSAVLPIRIPSENPSLERTERYRYFAAHHRQTTRTHPHSTLREGTHVQYVASPPRTPRRGYGEVRQSGRSQLTSPPSPDFSIGGTRPPTLAHSGL